MGPCGTLWIWWYGAGTWALEEAGREPTCTPEGIRPLFGKTMDEIALAFLPDQGPEERPEAHESCMAWEDR